MSAQRSVREWETVVAAIGVAMACASVSHSAVVGPEGLNAHRARQPVPLRGVPLGHATGLRLVVAARQPFILDVDTGSVRPVRGIPPMNRGVSWVVGVAGRAAVVVARSAPDTKIYGVRAGAARASFLGTGTDVAPAADGRTVWVKSFVARSRCGLRQVALDGREVRAPRTFRCASTIDAGGSLGVVVSRTRVLDPVTGRTVLRTRWGVLAAAGERLVLAGPDRRFTLIHAATPTRRRLLRWPSILTRLDEPAVDPRGRFVALAFADPSWKGFGRQVLDVWLLDAVTGKLTQLPGMPAFVSLKETSMSWTRDGRLVLLGESGGTDVIAVWRAGQRRLAVRTAHLRERIGSDTFAPLALM